MELFLIVKLGYFLIANGNYIIILFKYINLINIFFSDLAIENFKYAKIYNFLLDTIDDYQPLYNLIYSLKLIKLEILKNLYKNQFN